MLARTCKAFVTLALVVAALFIQGGSAEAHHQGLFFPIPKASYLLEIQLEKIGTWPWWYVERCNAANIYDAVEGAVVDSATFTVTL